MLFCCHVDIMHIVKLKNVIFMLGDFHCLKFRPPQYMNLYVTVRFLSPKGGVMRHCKSLKVLTKIFLLSLYFQLIIPNNSNAWLHEV